MTKIDNSATPAATVNRMAYTPPPSTRPATSTTNPIRATPEFDAARQRAQERATPAPQDSTYQPERSYRQQTFGARFGQVGVTLDVKA